MFYKHSQASLGSEIVTVEPPIVMDLLTNTQPLALTPAVPNVQPEYVL